MRITVKAIFPLCGGAIQAPAPPKRVPRDRLWLHRGKSAEGARVEWTTDAKGVAAGTLEPGTWCVAEAAPREALLKDPPPRRHQGCVERVLKSCDAVFEVKPDGPTRVLVEVGRECFWRRSCRDPLPPPP